MNASMNLNNYGYSYPNLIGNNLKQPLFKLISNIATSVRGKPWESVAKRIVKLAFHCLVATIFIVPAALAWLLGKSINYFSKTKIDAEGLSLAPPPIQVPQAVAGDNLINIQDISDKFSQLHPIGQKSPDQISKETSLRRLCDWTATQNDLIYPDDVRKRQSFCNQLSILLKGIIKKLDSGEIDKNKEESILKDLAEASGVCYPTWLEVATKLYGEVNGQVETVEVKLLRLIQEYKEAITLEFCQNEANAQWHALNYVRNILGTELGLNTMLNAYDPFAAQKDLIFGKALTKWIFLQRYENVNRLISSIQGMINSKPYDASYHDFLVEIVTERGIANPIDYVAEHFYDENYKIKETGINLMLRSVGVLK